MSGVVSEQTVSNALIKFAKRDSSVYMGKGDQVFIEADLCDDTLVSSCDDVVVPYAKVREWLDPESHFQINKGNFSAPRSLHIVICPFNSENLHQQLPVVEEIKSGLRIMGLETSYLYHEELRGPPNWFRLPLKNGFEVFSIKPEKFDSIYAHFSLTLVTSPTSNQITAILHLLLKSDLVALKQRLQPSLPLVGCPMLVPLILLELRTTDIHSDLAKARNEIYRIEKVIGTHKNYQKLDYHRQAGYYARGQEVWQRPGFEEASGELTSLATECGYWGRKCHMNLKMLEWITAMSTRPGANALLAERIAYMERGLEMNMIQCKYLAHRAEVQVQACASIMAQKDNFLSVELSKFANTTSLIAVRDSTDMRAIAFVTLAFLPGTFCATLFSTGFFNFDTGEVVISPWFWMYWVVSLGLIAVVFGSWILWGKLGKARKVDKSLKKMGDEA